MPHKYHYDADLTGNTVAARLMPLVGSNKNVLEVGCGPGSQSRVLAETLHCDVTGIEIDEMAAKQANEYCRNVVVGDIESMSLGKELGTTEFDVILFADVLEHLREPGKVLGKVRPHLSGTGYVLASIPNIVHASVVFEMIRGRFDYRSVGLLDHTHIRFFTKVSILSMFEKAGYVVTEMDRILREPINTEFSTSPVSDLERTILDYILEKSLESRTYQFIVKASKRTSQLGEDASFSIAQERIRFLEDLVLDKGRQIGRLESDLRWIQSKPTYRAIAALKRVFSLVRR